MNGFSSFNLTKLDVLDDFEEINITTHYEKPNGEKVEGIMPATLEELGEMKTVTKKMPGWKGPISGARDFKDLPTAAQNYVNEIEKELQVPVNWIGVGLAIASIGLIAMGS